MTGVIVDESLDDRVLRGAQHIETARRRVRVERGVLE